MSRNDKRKILLKKKKVMIYKKFSEIKEVSSIGIRTHMSDDACVFISYI